MADAATSVGTAQGFQGSLATARQRRIDEEERKRRHGREDLLTEGAEFELGRAQLGAERADTAYARNEEEFAKRTQEEGFLDFVNALNQGVDPRLAMDQFNSAGELKFEDVQFDPQSKRLSIRDMDGETMDFDDPNQLAAAMGIRLEQAEPVKLGKEDRLVDPSTGRTVVGAETTADKNLMKVGDVLYNTESGEWIMPPGSDKDRYIKVDKQLYDTENGTWLSPPGGAGGGRDISPFNPESTLQKIEQGIVRSHGGTFDALGNYSVPGDREIVDMKVGLAGEAFARLADYVREGNLSYSQIEEAVINATKHLSTDSELEKAGEAWRVKGWNKNQEEKQRWIQAERERQIMQARAKLLGAEQTMLARAGKKAAQRTLTEKPAWAGAEIPAATIGDANLEFGKEYDVEIEGQRMTIRVAPDGKVYQVGGGPQAAVSPAPDATQVPAPTRASQVPGQSRAGIERVNRRNDPMPTLASVREPEQGEPQSKAVQTAAKRARATLISDGEIPPKDIKLLSGLDDAVLSRLGLSDEQIEIIRATAIADGTLLAARRNEPEVNY